MEFPKKEIETLWAPWRFEYFERERNSDFLAEAARASDDAAHFVITRRKNAFLMMNRYPYTVGHLMAVPYRKIADPSQFLSLEIPSCLTNANFPRRKVEPAFLPHHMFEMSSRIPRRRDEGPHNRSSRLLGWNVNKASVRDPSLRSG